jgi:TPR repeat protein
LLSAYFLWFFCNRSLIYFLVVLGALCSVTVAHADFASAYRAYEQGDYVSAFDQFAEAAKGGHAASQVSLGWMYAQGLGVPHDDRQALYWYRQAAQQGHRDAQAILDIRRLGSTPQGHQIIVDGDSKGAGELTQEYFDSGIYPGREKDATLLEESQSAALWCRKSAEAGHREAQLVLGVRYELGQGVPQDTFRATYWYRKAAEQGSALAQFNLGLKYAIGEGVPLEQSMALYWYQRAAAQGHLESQYLVGVAYAQGNGVPWMPGQAVRWLQETAVRGYAPAQYYLGLMYAKGEGVARDWPRAYLWFSLAAAQGHDDARRNRDEAGMHIGPAEMGKVQQWVRHRASSRSLNSATGHDPKIRL